MGDTDQLITLPLVGEDPSDTPQQVEMGILGEIIRPRIEEIFEMLTRRLELNGFANAAGQRVVLVGGASQLQGMADYVAQEFGRGIRHGKPLGIVGMADATRGPAFSAAAGLLRFASAAGLLRFASVEQQLEPRREQTRGDKSGMLNRITHWFNTHI